MYIFMISGDVDMRSSHKESVNRVMPSETDNIYEESCYHNPLVPLCKETFRSAFIEQVKIQDKKNVEIARQQSLGGDSGRSAMPAGSPLSLSGSTASSQPSPSSVSSPLGSGDRSPTIQGQTSSPMSLNSSKKFQPPFAGKLPIPENLQLPNLVDSSPPPPPVPPTFPGLTHGHQQQHSGAMLQNPPLPPCPPPPPPPPLSHRLRPPNMSTIPAPPPPPLPQQSVRPPELVQPAPVTTTYFSSPPRSTAATTASQPSSHQNQNLSQSLSVGTTSSSTSTSTLTSIASSHITSTASSNSNHTINTTLSITDPSICGIPLPSGQAPPAKTSAAKYPHSLPPQPTEGLHRTTNHSSTRNNTTTSNNINIIPHPPPPTTSITTSTTPSSRAPLTNNNKDCSDELFLNNVPSPNPSFSPCSLSPASSEPDFLTSSEPDLTYNPTPITNGWEGEEDVDDEEESHSVMYSEDEANDLLSEEEDDDEEEEEEEDEDALINSIVKTQPLKLKEQREKQLQQAKNNNTDVIRLVGNQAH